MTRSPIRAEVIRLVRANVPDPEIARRIDRSIQYVRTVKSDARKAGNLAPHEHQHSFRWTEYTLQAQGSRVGGIREMLENLAPEHRLWLVAQTPPGAKLIDVLAAIVADTYAEENGQ